MKKNIHRKKVMEVLSDDENPQFLFNGINTKLLLNVMFDVIDLKELASKELSNRGFDCKGKWIGFKQARLFWTEFIFSENTGSKADENLKTVKCEKCEKIDCPFK